MTEGPLLLKCHCSHFGVTTVLVLSLCSECESSLKNGKLPPLSLANKTFLGPVPEELKNLTVIEEAMIARCRSKCWIIQLKEENQNLVLANTQRGIKGHIIIYPQQPSKIATVLPAPIEEITSQFVCSLLDLLLLLHNGYETTQNR
jgi:hypothetical protein